MSHRLFRSDSSSDSSSDIVDLVHNAAPLPYASAPPQDHLHPAPHHDMEVAQTSENLSSASVDAPAVCSADVAPGSQIAQHSANKRPSSQVSDAHQTAKLQRTASQSSLTSSSSSSSAMDVADPPREPRCPPIFLDTPKGWARHALTIRQLTTGKFNAVCTGKQMRIQVYTVPHFRSVQRYLHEEKVVFHTFNLPAEKPTRVIIRGLPLTLAPEEIQDELVGIGFAIEEVKRLKLAGGRQTNCWIVILRATDNDRPPTEVYTVTSLFCCRVRVERMKAQEGPSQCHKCQGFGHTSFHCGRQTRCVKCSGAHDVRSCPKSDSAPPVCCANCGGPHTANYRGCGAWKAERAKLRTRTSGRKPKTAPAPPKKGRFDVLRSDDPDDVDTAPSIEEETYEPVGPRRRRAPRQQRRLQHPTPAAPEGSTHHDTEVTTEQLETAVVEPINPPSARSYAKAARKQAPAQPTAPSAAPTGAKRSTTSSSSQRRPTALDSVWQSPTPRRKQNFWPPADNPSGPATPGAVPPALAAPRDPAQTEILAILNGIMEQLTALTQQIANLVVSLTRNG